MRAGKREDFIEGAAFVDAADFDRTAGLGHEVSP